MKGTKVCLNSPKRGALYPPITATLIHSNPSMGLITAINWANVSASLSRRKLPSNCRKIVNPAICDDKCTMITYAHNWYVCLVSNNSAFMYLVKVHKLLKILDVKIFFCFKPIQLEHYVNILLYYLKKNKGSALKL